VAAALTRATFSPTASCLPTRRAVGGSAPTFMLVRPSCAPG
jgi:hypothetical protein